MTIKEMRKQLGVTQSEFASRYNIPFRTIQNWEDGSRKPSQYIIDLLEAKVKDDLINRKTIKLPTYNSNKKNLPKRGDYYGPITWLQAVKEELGENVVFALDEALMCQGNFGGHNDEFIIWVYGSDDLAKYNGVVVLGNYINSHYVINNNGLQYTNFNRTLLDSLTNESILDMQGITEGLSKYYFTHNESFEGIDISPKYQHEFENLAYDAIDYYNS